MADNEESATQPDRPRVWRRRILIVAAILFGLLVIFHRPLLLHLTRALAVHFAAKENLKLSFQIDGSVLSGLLLRNVHAVPTGPSAVESIDADLVRVDYSIPDLIFHGPSEFLRNVEVSSASIVLDPRKALPPKPPKPNEKITLPAIFPERVHLVDATVIVRNRPHDFVMEHVDLDLNPRNPGQLKIDKLQLVGGQVWLKVDAQTSYANRILILREVALSNDERVRELRVDASRIGERKLAINLDYSVGAGELSGSFALYEAQSSLNTDLHLHAEN
ncbi:MAG TPA: hypothetical protein VIL70_01210, partial [Chthoniobacterales bacterium]